MSETAGRYTLKMPVPVMVGKDGAKSEMLTEVVVRRVKAGDLRVTDGVTGSVAQSIALLAKVTGVDVRTIDRLDSPDFQALVDMLDDSSSGNVAPNSKPTS
jgi:hypothetical protein